MTKTEFVFSITETSHVPATVELIDPRNNPHKLQVKVLASEETWQTPILLLASKAEDGGKVLFSQVFFCYKIFQF